MTWLLSKPQSQCRVCVCVCAGARHLPGVPVALPQRGAGAGGRRGRRVAAGARLRAHHAAQVSAIHTPQVSDSTDH